MKEKYISFKDFCAKEKLLLENEAVLLEFEKVFPMEIVRASSVERPLEVNEENMGKIFDILNAIFFGSVLKKIPVKCMTTQDIASYLANEFDIYMNKTRFSSTLAFYFEYSDEDNDNKTFVARDSSRTIFVNLDECTSTISVGFAAECILHEMIHYYDYCFGEIPRLEYQRWFNHISFNEHDTQFFKAYMNKALKQDILISPSVEGKSIEELNEIAQRYFLNENVEEIKVESLPDSKTTSLKMFKVKNGGMATFCFNAR